MGTAFWRFLEDDVQQLPKGDRDLLRDIFNPGLSDRHCEGDLFVPPDAGYANVTRLRALIKEEDKIRQRRKEHFFCKDFAVDNPGALFPASWAPSCEVSAGDASLDVRSQGTLQLRPNFKGEGAVLLQQVLTTSVPIFDRMTEEGLRFLMYRLGSLEVRTTQGLNGEESIGAVFSICKSLASMTAHMCQPVQEQEKIVSAVEYVEQTCVVTDDGPIFSHHYFVVLNTENNKKIVTEQLSDGTVRWTESSANQVDRCSLAKVTRTTESCIGMTVKDLKAHQQLGSLANGKASSSAGRRYAQKVFDLTSKQ